MRMSVNDTLDSVFSAIYHLNRLDCLEYSTWANLKEKLELAIKEEKEQLHNEITSSKELLFKYENPRIEGNGVKANLPNNITEYRVNNKFYTFNNVTGKVYVFNNEINKIEDTNLPEKANVVFIEGDTLKAITDKGIYLLENNNWKLKRTISENDTSKYIDQITYIFNNDGNEFDPMKYVYNVYTKKVDVYLNVDNVHPAETIEGVDDFYCNKYGAACFIRGKDLYLKPCTYLNPCFISFVKYNFNNNDIVIEDMYITDSSKAYIVMSHTLDSKYKIYYYNLHNDKFINKENTFIFTDIDITTDYWYREVNNKLFFCTITKEHTKYGQCIKPNKLYTIDHNSNNFLIEITDSNRSKYGNYTAEDLFFNNTASEGVK